MHQRPLKDAPLIFFDLQTTGSSPAHHHIIEVGYGLTEPGQQSLMLSHLISLPEDVSLHRRIQSLTGISATLLESEGQPFAELWPEVQEKLGQDRPCVIHYARFENSFLKAMDESLPFPPICTYEISRRLFPSLPSKSLRGISGYLGFPIGELKRSCDHLKATSYIWYRMIPHLEARGVHHFQDLREWLKHTKPDKAEKKVYAISREVRLKAPDHPGIYQMLDKRGQVLYVGKATNLKSRVNSYFRGQKTKGSRLNEMVSQVHDIKTIKAPSPTAAALLESQLIKEKCPPYNRAIKTSGQEIFYLNHSIEMANTPLDAHYGPLTSESYFAHAFDIIACLDSGNLAHEAPFDVEPDIVNEGIKLLHRHYKDEIQGQRIHSFIVNCWSHSIRKRREDIRLSLEGDEDEELKKDVLDDDEPTEWLPEDVFRHFLRVLAGVGHRMFKARWLLRLTDCQFSWTADGQTHHGIVSGAKASFFLDSLEDDAPKPQFDRPRQHRIELMNEFTFTNLNVLMSEVKRLVKNDQMATFQYHQGSPLQGAALKKVMFPEMYLAED